MRRGWTLPELLISMTVLAMVLALAAHLAAGQLRFFGGVGRLTELQGQIGQAAAITANLLWGLSPPAGDVTAALDSAIEFRMPTGSALVCSSAPGRVTIAAPAGAGNAHSAFIDPPEPGDRIAVLYDDSLGTTWLTVQVTSPPAPEGACPAFPGVARAWTFSIAEAMALPTGAALRFTRPFRLSLYRAADGNWFLGARDWNGEWARFNAIQPVAGPLGAYRADPRETGLLFVYRDARGAALDPPVPPTGIAGITIVARGTARDAGSRYAREDSVAVTVALRNAP